MCGLQILFFFVRVFFLLCKAALRAILDHLFFVKFVVSVDLAQTAFGFRLFSNMAIVYHANMKLRHLEYCEKHCFN